MRDERLRTSAWEATGRKVIRINEMIPKEKICFDPLSNSQPIFQEMYEGQSGEFVC